MSQSGQKLGTNIKNKFRTVLIAAQIANNSLATELTTQLNLKQFQIEFNSQLNQMEIRLIQHFIWHINYQAVKSSNKQDGKHTNAIPLSKLGIKQSNSTNKLHVQYQKEVRLPIIMNIYGNFNSRYMPNNDRNIGLVCLLKQFHDKIQPLIYIITSLSLHYHCNYFGL